MKLSQFVFDLPLNLIAQHPTKTRDDSRMMVVHRKTGQIEDKHFRDVMEYFDNQDVFVVNNTKVFPARMYGRKEKTGAKVEVFLLRELDKANKLWDVIVDPARKIRVGNRLYFGDTDEMVAEVVDNTTSRGRTIKFLWDGTDDEYRKMLEILGETPEVANTGWEFSGEYMLNNRFSARATFSIMNSYVKDSTGNYLSIQLNGKAPGSKLINLPHHTAGLFMTYSFNKLFGEKDHGAVSFNVTEVDGVYTLDGVRYLIDLAYGRTKASIRDYNNGYWTTTGTVFRLGLNIDYYLNDRLRFFVQGNNMANSNKFEQASNLPTYGASWMFGIKYFMTKGI
jgi:Queuosine biosynthesis protein